MERIEEMSAERAEGISPGSTATSCTASSSTARFRDALGLDYDRIATDRAGMLWAGEGMPHRFDACCEISDIARRLRAQCRDVASRSESPGPRRAASSLAGASILRKDTHGPNVPGQRNGASRWTDESSRSC